MEYLKIHDWDEWQSYRKDRGQPPWIKVHRKTLRKPKWVALTDEERGQLIAMWILAADENGSIPNDPKLIQKLCYMTKPPNLNHFRELGWIEINGCHNDANLTPSCQPNDPPKAEAEAEAEKRREEKILSLGSFKNVKLTKGEYESLFEKFGEQNTKIRVETLSEYIASKGKKYRNHYATILAWARKAGIPDKKSDPNKMICRNCGKETHALVSGLCWKCKELSDGSQITKNL